MGAAGGWGGGVQAAWAQSFDCLAISAVTPEDLPTSQEFSMFVLV